MSKITTKELFDRYYDSVKGTSAEKTRPRIDRPELYMYEEKVGKQLIDMDVEDLFGLIIEFKNKRNGKEINFMTSHASFDQLSTLLRALFNYYIDNIEPIRNPMNDKRIKGKEATKRLAQGREPFSFAIVEDIIRRLHMDFDEDKADYIELIMLMYYNGFVNAEEIVMLKPDMIDHRNGIVKLLGRQLKLSNRCYELLTKFDRLDKIAGWRGDFLLARWNGGYFKFIIRQKEEYELNNRPLSVMCNVLNRCIAVNVNNKYDTKINYHNLYLLGFYEYVVKQIGEENANRIITSYRDSEDVITLMSLARNYGWQIDNVSHLKRYLRPFIDVEV